MRERIKKILNKRSLSDEIKLIQIRQIIEEDNSINYGFNKLVKLSISDYDKLVDGYGKQLIEVMIDRLDSYMFDTGKQYSKHYLTILNWLRRQGEKPIVRKTTYICPYGIEHKIGENCLC